VRLATGGGGFGGPKELPAQTLVGSTQSVAYSMEATARNQVAAGRFAVDPYLTSCFHSERRRRNSTPARIPLVKLGRTNSRQALRRYGIWLPVSTFSA
jgi:hypothetical protein